MIPIKDVRGLPVRTFMKQIAVISNHQNGRDTHMRQIKIHSTDLDFIYCHAIVDNEKTNILQEFGNFSTV